MNNKKIIFITLIIIIMSGYLFSSYNKLLYETRGTWLWAGSIDSNDKMLKNIKKILKANLNTVFLSIPGVFKNYGHGKEKYFASFIKLAYKNELSVHAWFSNGRRLGRKQHVNFSNKNEQLAQIKWVAYFLKKYKKYLDGIHLDYIRVEKGTPVNRKAMKGITDTISGIREIMNKNYPEKFLTTAVFPTSPALIRPYNMPLVWNQDVPQWFKSWVKNNPNSRYRVFRRGTIRIGTPAFMIYQQDPIIWLKKSLIDATIPMQYTTLDKKWKDEIIQFQSFFKYNEIKDKHLIASLGWMPKRNERSTRGYDTSGIVSKIKEGRKNNIQGFFIFILSNHGYNDSPLINALTIPSKTNSFSPPFSKRAISLISRYKKRKE